MGLLDELKRRLIFVRDNKERILVKTINKNNLDAEMIDLNHNQLEKGNLSTGKKVTPRYRNPNYARFKRSRGSKSGSNPDLKLTGNFYRGFKATNNGTKFKIDSTDSKRNKLVDKYSLDIFGLSKESEIKYIDIVEPFFFEDVAEIIIK